MRAPGAVLQTRYRIVRIIAEGGMGRVYEATDERLGHTVALKETVFSDVNLRKAFEREARLLAGLRHPALPVVSDHFTEGEGQFLVMQYIPGDDLARLLKRQSAAFSPGEVLMWADQLLDVLDYLHTRQPPIIHRDIKPQNLKLTERGQIILLDFGLAKGAASGMTLAGASASLLAYTPGYAALEQIQGSGTDPRSDLYALAATLYHLITGVEPPSALTRATALVNSESDPLAWANYINPYIPPAVTPILHWALALKRDDRPPTASTLRRALHDAGGATRPDASAAPTLIGGSQTPPAPPSYGQTQAGPPSYGQTQAGPPSYGQTQAGQTQAGQTQAYGQTHAYGQTQTGPPPYGQTQGMMQDSRPVMAMPTQGAALTPAIPSAPAQFTSPQTLVKPSRSLWPLLLIAVIVVLGSVFAAVMLMRRSAAPSPDAVKPNNPPGSTETAPGGTTEAAPGPTQAAPGGTEAAPGRAGADVPTRNSNSAPSRVPSSTPDGTPDNVPGRPVAREAPPPPDNKRNRNTEPSKVIRQTGGVLQGSATRRVEPAYPPLAKAARVGGVVVVEITVDEAGNVISAHALSGHPMLQDAAVKAARGWKFTPTLLDGAPVKVIGTITFNFSL